MEMNMEFEKSSKDVKYAISEKGETIYKRGSNYIFVDGEGHITNFIEGTNDFEIYKKTADITLT
jgi:hypothetical protein